MALRKKNPEVVKPAGEIAEETGKSLTDPVITALRDRIEHIHGGRNAASRALEVNDILHRLDALPTVDNRSEGEILGY